MKIRTQLVFAFLLLAVLPLTGIVLYSYVSSLRAVRRETESQARTLASEMNGRLASVKGELDRGVERMRDVPAREILTAARSTGKGQSDPRMDEFVLGFGEAAPFLQALEFVPMPPSRDPASAPSHPEPPEPPHTVRRVVINVPGILQEMRREMEADAAADPDPVARQAIEAALAALGPVEAPPVPPAPPEPGEPPQEPQTPWAGIPQAAIEQIQEEMAKEQKKVQEATRVSEREQAAIDRKRAAIDREREKALEAIRAAERKQAAIDRERRAAIDKERDRMDRLVFGRALEVPVRERGRVVGKVKAQVRSNELLRGILTRTRGIKGEIPFAIDAEGELHTDSDDDRRKLEGLHSSFSSHVRAGSGPWAFGYWAVATSKDPESGLVFGIARPMPLQNVRRTAARNFGYGLGMIGLALFGILPLSTRMTRNVKLVTDGADRIAKGDLEARVPVRSRNEFGKLALAFNQMAADLKGHQGRLLEEERLRKEREIEQALLRTEYERKTQELEEARRFQLSLLPKALPEHPGFEVAVSMRTATEVGGDYYDFFLADDGALTVAVGDATGHGATAGTMVTVVKSLFSADAGASRPRQFLAEAARAVKRMELGRMAMGLCLARLEGRTLTLSSAGMPPVFVCRQASGKAEEIALQGMPLGGLASDYQERLLEVDPGDTILLMTDGLPELTNADGDPLGYPRVRSLFESLSAKPTAEVIAGLTAAAESWAAGLAPKDDMTLVVVRMRA
jgi:serine phosphatase RsbU (regulator of sigma subunit)